MALRITEMKDEEGKTIPKLEEDLGNVGVKLKDGNNNLRSTYDILKDLSSVWGSIGKDEQLGLLDKLGGKRQANILAATITNFAEAEKVLQDSMTSSGSAMAEQEKYMESLEYKVDVFKEKVNGLYQTMINSDFLKGMVDGGSDAISLLDGLSKKFGAMNTVITGSSLILFAFNKRFREMSSSITESFTYTKLLQDKTKNFINEKKEEIKTLLASRDAAVANGQSTTAMTTKLIGCKVATIGATIATYALQAALTVGIGIAISMAIQGVAKLINHYKDLKEANEEVARSYKENSQANRDNAEYVKSISQEYNELTNKTHLTAEETERLKDIKQRLADIFPELVQGMNDETGEMILQKKTSKELLDILKERQQIENAKLMSNGDKALEGLQHDLKDKQEKLNKLKSDLDEINTGMGGKTMTNPHTGEAIVNVNNIEALKAKYDELAKKQLEGKDVTKELADVEKDLAKAYAERKIKMGEITAAQNEMKASLTEFRPYIQAIISQHEGLNEAQKKLIENQIQLKPEDILKVQNGDYSSLMAEVTNIIEQIKSDAEMNKIDILLQVKNPDDKQIKDYLDSIFKMADKYKVKPLDLMKMFPLQINKAQLESSVNEYITSIESAMSKANGKSKDMTANLEGAKNLLLDIQVKGKEDLDETANSMNNVEQSAKSLQESFNQTMDKMEFYKQLMKEIHDTHGLTQQSIRKIINDHAELIPYIGDTQKMYKILQDKLVDTERTAQTSYQNMIYADNAFSQEVYKNTNWLADMKNKWYDTDFSNWKTLAEGKEKVEAKIIANIAGMWAKYYDKQSGALKFQEFAQDNMMTDGTGHFVMSKGGMEAYKKANSMQSKIQEQYAKLAKDMKDVAGGVNFSKLNVSKPSASGSSKSGKSAADKAKADREKKERERLEKLKKELDDRLKQYELAIARLDRDISLAKDQKELNKHHPINTVALDKRIENNTKKKLDTLRQEENFINKEIKSGKYNKDMLNDLNGKLISVQENISKVNIDLKKLKVDLINDEYHKRIKKSTEEIETLLFKIEAKDSQDIADKEKLKFLDDLIKKRSEQYQIAQKYTQELNKQLKSEKDSARRSALQDSIENYTKITRDLNIELIKARQEKENFIKELTVEADKINKYTQAVERLSETIRHLDIELNRISISIDTAKMNNNIVGAFGLYDDYIRGLSQKMFELRNQIQGLQRVQTDLKQEFKVNFGIDVTGMSQSDLQKTYDGMFPTTIASSNKEKEEIEKKKELFKELMSSYNELNTSIEENKDKQLSLNKEQASAMKEQQDMVLDHIKKVQDDVKSMMKKSVDDEKKRLDDRLKNLRDFINKRQKELDRQWSQEDYDRDLQKKIEEKNKILAEIEDKQRDTSISGQATVKRLQEELQKMEEELSDFQRGRNRDLQKQVIQDELEAKEKSYEQQKEDLDKLLTEEELNIKSKQALIDGFYKDLNGNTISLKESMLDFIKETSDGMSIVGNKLQTELIDNLTQAQELIKVLDDLSYKTAINDSFLGTTQAYMSDIKVNMKPFDSNKVITTDMINKRNNNNSINYQIDKLVEIGTVYDKGDIQGLIKQGVETGFGEVEKIKRKKGL